MMNIETKYKLFEVADTIEDMTKLWEFFCDHGLDFAEFVNWKYSNKD